MKIKRTVIFEGLTFGDSEIIDKARMEEIIKQVASLGANGSLVPRTETAMEELTRTGKLESWYARYELVKA